MKTCPICKATCFEDMEVCFGCMHRFGVDEPAKSPTGPLVIPEIETPPSSAVENNAASSMATEAETPAEEPRKQGRHESGKLPRVAPVTTIPLGAPGVASLDGGAYQLVISLQPVAAG